MTSSFTVNTAKQVGDKDHIKSSPRSSAAKSGTRRTIRRRSFM